MSVIPFRPCRSSFVFQRELHLYPFSFSLSCTTLAARLRWAFKSDYFIDFPVCLLPWLTKRVSHSSKIVFASPGLSLATSELLVSTTLSVSSVRPSDGKPGLTWFFIRSESRVTASQIRSTTPCLRAGRRAVPPPQYGAW